MFLTPPAVAPIALQMPVMTSPTAHHHKARPSSTRSGSVRFHDDEDDVESETEDPSEPTSDDLERDDEPSTILVSSRAGVDEVEVESRHSNHTRGSKSRASHRSSKSKRSARSAPVSRSNARQDHEPCRGTCILCMDRKVERTGISCGHEISCSECSARLLACPVCGGPSAPPPPPRRQRSASSSASSSAPSGGAMAVQPCR